MDDAAVRTLKVKDKPAVSRRLFVIKPRERKELPGQTVEIPSPSRYHQPPAAPNMITMILPPVLMLVMYGVLFAFMLGNRSSGLPSGFGVLFLITPLIGMGTPLATYISHKYQVKKYAETLKIREGDYREKLRNARFKLDELVSLQREILNGDYPLLPRLIQTGLGKRHQKYLWWRRMADPDFLSLRMGTGYEHPSFSVVPPKVMDAEDPLFTLSQETLQAYKDIPQLPVLLDLKTVGSVGLSDRNGNLVYGFARKLILDVIVHHSPQDVQVVVLGDTPDAQERWEWLKWTPHTRAIYEGEGNRRLAFDSNAVDKAVGWLMNELGNRTNKESRIVKRNASQTAIVVILDDSGSVRRSEDIKFLSESGRDVGIYLVFVGGRENWPRECRASIEIRDGEFSYTETFAGEQSGAKKRGELETAGILDCERIARALAGLEISIGGTSSALPKSVRLFDILEPDGVVSKETVRRNWNTDWKDEDLLQFKFGLQNGRKGLEPIALNLLPPLPYSGIGAYHTILVGYIGGGKSEFMKTLVLSAAYKYSPKLLNFFLMDFKGGAAFNPLRELPHVTGVVTNLNPLLVERALASIKTEFERRQNVFAGVSAKDIWEYNSMFPKDPMPHLLLVLDEFSIGMNDFPALPLILSDLVRVGRALGFYLFLANQDVTSAVDRLLNNVGWRIALRLADQKDMHVIDRSKPKVENTGQGYLRSLDGDIYEFQAAFSGFPMQDPGEKVEAVFKIFQVQIDGKWQPIYSNARRFNVTSYETPKIREQDYLISAMKELSREIEPASRIYLEPLDPDISLENVLQESEIRRIFEKGGWPLHKTDRGRLVALIGYTDSIEKRIQALLKVDFEDQDGHLWLIGAAASGKAMTIETALLSLALTNTPEDVWFYLVDFGTMGRLKHLSMLPHCGAYITPKDPLEMVERLFRLLEDEMLRRSNGSSRDIFLVINNFAEFRSQFADHIERLVPFINNGKAAGIHLIISTNRRIDLLNKMAIARRIVLRLTNRDEYSDAAGERVTVLPVLQAEGRGLWVDGKHVECQVARARVVLDENGELTDPEDVCETLAKAWHGGLPPQIQILPAQIPLADLHKQMTPENTGDKLIPIGLSYETMQPVTVDLLKELPRWLVLGPPRSGKSNFLISIAETIHSNVPDQWDVRYISLRRAHSGVKSIHAESALSPGEALQMLEGILNKIESAAVQEKKLLLLLDDLGSFFEPGKEALAAVLNNFALKTSSHDDVFIIGAGLQDELIRQGSSRLVQDLKRNKTGIVFSRESADLDFMGIQMMQLPVQYRRMDLNPGRGFWCSGGKPLLVQSPLVGK